MATQERCVLGVFSKVCCGATVAYVRVHLAYPPWRSCSVVCGNLLRPAFESCAKLFLFFAELDLAPKPCANAVSTLF